MKIFLTKCFATLFLCLTIGVSNSSGQDTTTWFVNSIFIPQQIDVDENTPLRLRIDPTIHNFNPSRLGAVTNTFVATLAYNAVHTPWSHSVLGPTIRWHYKDSVDLSVTNNTANFTTTHWHGAHVPVQADGGPHQRIQPGETWTNRIQVKDESATMWYHPHGMDVTYEHVQMGLSGMLYVDDPTGDNISTPLDSILHVLHDSLPANYGTNDFPLIFQTKKFDNNNGVVSIRARFDPACGEPGYKKDYEYIVNGRIDPYLQVPKSLVRLRILNGDAKFSFNLGIGQRDFNPDGFHLLATDAGYTDSTYAMNEILIAPGERTEILYDFSQYNHGDTLFIYNKVSDMPAGVIGDSATTEGFAKDRVLLKIVVNQFFGIPPSPLVLPRALRPLESLDLDKVSNTRTKVFRKDVFTLDSCNTGMMADYNLYNIDSALMDMMRVDDVVLLDSTEKWIIDNTTPHAHPFHIHDIHFNVVEIQDKVTGTIYNRANPGNYNHIFKGPKDNVLVLPNWKLTFTATFDDFGTEISPQNTYMYHCHILPHEDRGMMGQFVVWDKEQFPDSPVNTEEPDVVSLSMKLFPNPTRDVLYLEGASRDQSTVRFFDIQGRLLREQNLAPFDGTTQLDAGYLPKGMILVQWITNEGQVTKKVIIQ